MPAMGGPGGSAPGDIGLPPPAPPPTMPLPAPPPPPPPVVGTLRGVVV